MSRVSIAVCCDIRMKIGLHVTLHSMLEHLPEDCLIDVYFFHDGYSDADIARLNKTISLTGRQCNLLPKIINVELFHSYRSLLGNYMVYARLLLASELPDLRKVLYLDSDLIVRCNLQPLFEIDMGGHCIGAVPGGPIRYSLENDFYISMGFDPEAICFNSGILLLNLENWRQQNIFDQCMNFLDRHSGRFKSHDQSALNGVFYNNYFPIPKCYNVELSPVQSYEGAYPEGILHLLGSPKPWDFLGEFINPHGHEFIKQLDETAYRGWRSYKDMKSLSLRKVRSYLRVCLQKYRLKISRQEQ